MPPARAIVFQRFLASMPSLQGFPVSAGLAIAACVLSGVCGRSTRVQ
jgi:hypothetical protein